MKRTGKPIQPHLREVLSLAQMAQPDRGEAVILLHGLGRTVRSMWLMEQVLTRAGYRVVNQGYPSRRASILDLAYQTLPQAVMACGDAHKIHFVTHSMGGMLLRAWAAQSQEARLSRAVMLGPPNGGSPIVDRLGSIAAFGWINGPAGSEMGSAQDALPKTLPTCPGMEIGIIAGTRCLNPFYGAMMGEPSDGKVTVSSAFALEDAKVLALPVSHTWMMMDAKVAFEVMHFLEKGHFS